MGPRPATTAYVCGWCTDDGPSRQAGLRSCKELLRFAMPDDEPTPSAAGLAGPVRFHVIDGHRAHLFLARRSQESNDPTLREYLRQLREKLREKGGLILVASAPAHSAAQARGCQSRALREGMRQAQAAG